MAGRKKQTHLRIYTKLLHGLSEANKNLPEQRQLSLAQRRQLVSQKLYPKYKDTPVSKFRVGEAREQVKKALKAFQRAAPAKRSKKKQSHLAIYGKLLHELSEINKHLPENRKLSLAERRKLVSQRLYRKYKDTAVSKFRVLAAREEIYKALQAIKPKEGFDVTAIPEDAYQQIPYYDIERYLRSYEGQEPILLNGIFVKVNAANFGVTKIFNNRDYEQHRVEINGITNNINAWVRQQPPKQRDSDKVPFYTGFIQLKPNKKPGNPEDYYLEFVLVVRGIMAENLKGVELPKVQKGTRESKRVKKIKDIIRERLKGITTEKSKIKAIKKSVQKEIDDTKLILKKKNFPIQFRREYKDRTKASELKRIKKYVTNETITEKQYKELAAKINKAYK